MLLQMVLTMFVSFFKNNGGRLACPCCGELVSTNELRVRGQRRNLFLNLDEVKSRSLHCPLCDARLASKGVFIFFLICFSFAFLIYLLGFLGVHYVIQFALICLLFPVSLKVFDRVVSLEVVN